MNEKSVDSSPLKLYQQAYALHYKERKIAAACDIYEQLIKEFPDSDVSAYASIQLQKINADRITRSMARRSKGSFPPSTFIALALICIIAIAVIFAVHLHSQEVQDAQDKLITHAMGKMYRGKDDDALDILKTAKLSNPKDIIPFLLASEIYRKNHEYMKAKKEFETYHRLNPEDALAEIEINTINEEEDAYIGNKMKRQEEQKAIPEEMVGQEDREARERTEARKRRTTRAQPAKKMPKLLVPRDSISFF